MKIIDLLNKIANGERVPEKIKFDNEIFEYDEKEKDYANIDFSEYLFEVYLITDILNDEVEILETTITYKKDEQNDKIEYLDDFYKDDRFGYSIDLEKIRDKINEIIDHLNNQ